MPQRLGRTGITPQPSDFTPDSWKARPERAHRSQEFTVLSPGTSVPGSGSSATICREKALIQGPSFISSKNGATEVPVAS